MSEAQTSQEGSVGATPDKSPLSRAARIGATTAVGLLLASVVWWGWGRYTAPDRRLAVEEAGPVTEQAPEDGVVRVLAWNIAHGRGDTEQGVLQNWLGGSATERLHRLEEIAAVIRRADADIVVLNEVDFDAGWSHGIDQAAFLARAAGYPNRVEQRNFDFRVPFESWAFGNALLTRLPIRHVRWIDLPRRSFWEDVLFGSKDAALVRVGVGVDSVATVPVHLEFRAGDTRSRAVPVLEEVRRQEPARLVLAGDFNTAPPGWPNVPRTTALGALLSEGWRSARALRPPRPEELTFPTYEPVESRDWILVEPTLQVLDARVLHGAGPLSDHAPVLAEIRVSTTPGTPTSADDGTGRDVRSGGH